jgi:hypothetical protein
MLARESVPAELTEELAGLIAFFEDAFEDESE